MEKAIFPYLPACFHYDKIGMTPEETMASLFFHVRNIN